MINYVNYLTSLLMACICLADLIHENKQTKKLFEENLFRNHFIAIEIPARVGRNTSTK